jgi:hypothetical protein
MNDQGEPSNSSSILKFAGVTISSVYFLGFLTVARHLSRYGISTFSLLQTQFLVAGIWTVAPLLAIALVHRTTSRFSDKAYRLSGFSWQRLLLIPAITGIPYGLFIGVLSLLSEGFQGFTWRMAGQLWLCYVFLAASADLALISWKAAGKSERWWINREATPFYVTVFFLGVLVYTLKFSTWVYPLIPYSLGGGKPRTIVFLPSEKPLPNGIIKDDSSGRSVSYRLLTETDTSYVVISPGSNEESIVIGRQAVGGIVVLRDSNAP